MESIENNRVDIAFLKTEIGDEKEFIVNLLTVFKQSMSSFIQGVNEDIISENKIGIKEKTHKLAPTCQMLGLEQLFQLLRKIESESANVMNIKQLNPDLSDVLAIIKKVIPQIDDIIENYE